MSAEAVLIAGPTASGKSAAALALAERVNGALIDTDSMQVYREPRILTARPSDADMARVPHDLYGHVSIHERYDVARYAREATDALERVRRNGRVPIFVGGTGLYFGALRHGIPDMPHVPASVREAARVRREQIGAQAFHGELATRDPESAARLRASDTQRMLRAWEVFEATGRPLSEWQKGKTQAVLKGIRLARFVLSPPRAAVHARIDARFDAMLAAGALEEVRRLGPIDPALPSAKLLGLRELAAVLAGTMALEEARERAKAATRQYAKRQRTWFRHRMTDWIWIESHDFSNILTTMLSQLA